VAAIALALATAAHATGEFAELAGAFLPHGDVALLLALTPSHEGRTLTAHAYSESGERCLGAIRAQFGLPIPQP